MGAPGADAPALSLSGVTRSFSVDGHKNTALDRIDLRIPAARVTGLIGPDGAGKTTLMRLVAGLLLPDSGAIHAIGIDVIADPDAGLAFLEPAFEPPDQPWSTSGIYRFETDPLVLEKLDELRGTLNEQMDQLETEYK